MQSCKRRLTSLLWVEVGCGGGLLYFSWGADFSWSADDFCWRGCVIFLSGCCVAFSPLNGREGRKYTEKKRHCCRLILPSALYIVSLNKSSQTNEDQTKFSWGNSTAAVPVFLCILPSFSAVKAILR